MFPELSFLKKIAAEKALDFIEPGMIVGVGSGSTVKMFIEVLSQAKIDVVCVPTSIDTELMLTKYGLRIASFLEIEKIDIAIDGADSILLGKNIILKGGGGALTREKIIDYTAARLIIIVDETKINREYPVVVEIVPFAYNFVVNRLKRYGKPELRISRKKLGPVVTDNGNWLIDLHIPLEAIDGRFEKEIKLIPGVVENGIFRRDARVIIGKKDGGTREIDINA